MNTRDKILTGARDYLLKFGQSDFTVRAVAKHAGVNHGLVHHYFGSKEKMILELIDQMDSTFKEVIEKQLKDKSLDELKVIVQNFFSQPETPKLMIAFIGFAQTNPEIAGRIALIIEERKKMLELILDRKNPLDIPIMLAAIQGVALQNSIRSDFPLQSAIERVFELFFISFEE